MRKPIFKEIKKFIKQQINNNTYNINEKIPTEEALAKLFKTSRQTVNKALSELALEGIVTRFPRRGTFVSDNKAQTSILDLTNIADEIAARGNIHTSKIISLKTIKAQAKIAQMLNLVKDQQIYVSKIIHKENDVPMRFDVHYINPQITPHYLKQDFNEITPNEYLQKHCLAQQVKNTIEATLVNKNIANYLDIAIQEPCLLISRIIISNTKVSSYSKVYYPSTRYKLNSIVDLNDNNS